MTYNANGAAAATSAAAEGWHAGAAGASGADSNVYNNLQLQYVQGPSGPELVLPLMGQSAASQDNGGAYGTQAPYYNTMSSRRGRGRGSRGGFGSGGLGAGAAVGGRNVRGRGWRAAKQQQAAIRKPLTRPPVASYSSSPYGSPYLPSAAAMAIGAAGSPQQYNYHGQPASPALSVSQPMDSMQVDHNLQLDTLHRQQSLIDSPVYKAIAQIVMVCRAGKKKLCRSCELTPRVSRSSQTSPKLAEVRRVLQDGNSGSGGVLLAPAPSSKPKPTKVCEELRMHRCGWFFYFYTFE